MIDFTVVIPARFASTRLPGKLLLDIEGKPLIQRVYERACESGAKRIIIATDDERIGSRAAGFGAEICMTSSHHHSGTERIAEVAELLNFKDNDIVVNLQGDEPLMPSQFIQLVANEISKNVKISMATICYPISHAIDLFNPNIVKVVMDDKGNALYFSRAPIPWDRECFSAIGNSYHNISLKTDAYFRHVGLYAYSTKFIKQYVKLKSSRNEKLELLEQLRVLDAGYAIHISKVLENPGIGIDTEQDLLAVRAMFNKRIGEGND